MSEEKQDDTKETQEETSESNLPFELKLDEEHMWLTALFGLPVTVQMKEPLWKIVPQGVMKFRGLNPDGEPGVMCYARPVVKQNSDKSEREADDLFECVELAPTQYHNRVVLMEGIPLGDQGMARVLYLIDAADIRCVTQAFPSAEQARASEQEPRIQIPGAPDNEPGKVIV
jgi:hypothetical protein